MPRWNQLKTKIQTLVLGYIASTHNDYLTGPIAVEKWLREAFFMDFSKLLSLLKFRDADSKNIKIEFLTKISTNTKR